MLLERCKEEDVMDKNTFKSFLDKLIGEDSWVGDTISAPHYYVAAGNPASNSISSVDKDLVERLKHFAGTDEGFIVAGNSMAPKGIFDTNAIACRKIEEKDSFEIPAHKFVVIRVDKDWYKKHRKGASFDYKLRFTLCNIPLNAEFSEFYRVVSESEDSVLVPENKKELKKKFDEAVKYYGTDTPLILSLTFKEGKTHYSIHPASHVEYEVVALGRLSSDGNWNREELPAA